MVFTQDQKSESMITIIRSDVTMEEDGSLEKLNAKNNNVKYENGKTEKNAKKSFLLDDTEKNEEALFDDLMVDIGNDSRFQNRFNMIYNFVLVTIITLPYLNIVLAMSVPEHWCHVPGRELTNFTLKEWKERTLPLEKNTAGGAESLSSCRMYSDSNNTEIVECQNGWEYDRTWYSETVPSLENWVCDRELQVTNTFVAGRIGEIIGTFVFGQLGDFAGRRPVFYISLAMLVIGRVSSAFTSHIYSLFLATIVLGSMATTSVFQSPLVICMEISSDKQRANIAFLQCLGWVIGMCALPMIAWLVGDWSWFMLITSIPPFIYFFMYKFMPESPRWLATRGKVKEALAVLKYIARVNQTKLPERAETVLQRIADKKEPIFGFASLFTHWRLAKNTLILIVCWVVCAISYYALVLNVTNMAGNPFMNFFWQSLVELPGYVTGRALSNLVGRRWTQTGSYLLVTLMCFTVITVQSFSPTSGAVIFFVALIKLGVTTSFYMVWLQAIEIYPTCARQSGTAIGGFVSNILGITGPYVVLLGTAVDIRLPYVVLTFLALLGCTCSFFLPETLNKKLPETLEDAQNFGKDQGYWDFKLNINRKKK